MEVFRQHLVLDRDDVKVTLATDLRFEEPVTVHGRPVLDTGSEAVWFTFPGRWHDVGRFHTPEGRFTGLYANVLTPPDLGPDHVWETTDLFLDVWLDADGTISVLDRDQLREAVDSGWVDPATAERARAEAERIVSERERGLWPPPVVQEWTLARARKALEEGGR